MRPTPRRETILFLRRCAAGGRGLVPVRDAADAAELLGWSASPAVLPLAAGSRHDHKGYARERAFRRFARALAAFDLPKFITDPPDLFAVGSWNGSSAPFPAESITRAITSAMTVAPAAPDLGLNEVALGEVVAEERRVVVRSAWVGTTAWRFARRGREAGVLWESWQPTAPWLPDGSPTRVDRVLAPWWWVWAYRNGWREDAAALLAELGAERDPPAELDRSKQPTTPRYLLVVSTGPLVIVRPPPYAIPWRRLVQAVGRVVRDHGAPLKSVSSIEGLAGFSRADNPQDDARNVARLEMAFAGAAEPYDGFWLYDWDDASGAFKLARPPARR